MFRLAQQPRNVFTIIGHAFCLYGSTFKKFLPYFILFAVLNVVTPLLVLTGVLAAPVAGHSATGETIIFSVCALVGLWPILAAVRRIFLSGKGEEMTTGAGWAFAASRYIRFLLIVITMLALLGVVVGLSAMLGFALMFVSHILAIAIMIIPGAILYVFVHFMPTAVAADDKTYGQAFVTSFVLVANNWWRTFFVMVVSFVIYFIVAGAIDAICNLVLGHWGSLIGVFVTSLFFAPWLLMVQLVMYNNLKLRKGIN